MATLALRISTRGGFLNRIGAAVVGASAANLIATRTKAFASHMPPACCYGMDSCTYAGCNCPDWVGGDCCWVCTTELPDCKTWRCCDRFDLCGGCICPYLVCNCC